MPGDPEPFTLKTKACRHAHGSPVSYFMGGGRASRTSLREIWERPPPLFWGKCKCQQKWFSSYSTRTQLLAFRKPDREMRRGNSPLSFPCQIQYTCSIQCLTRVQTAAPGLWPLWLSQRNSLLEESWRASCHHVDLRWHTTTFPRFSNHPLYFAWFHPQDIPISKHWRAIPLSPTRQPVDWTQGLMLHPSHKRYSFIWHPLPPTPCTSSIPACNKWLNQ